MQEVGGSLEFHKDVWSSGQMASKLWVCEQLEKFNFTKPQTIWILGGWHGLLAQLLLTRARIPILKIRSFDIDPACEFVADQINNLWQWQDWKFKAFTFDCNKLNYAETEKWASGQPDIIVNTAVEHFVEADWWLNVPNGALCVLQSNDMDHGVHTSTCKSLKQLQSQFPMRNLLYSGELFFDYKNETNFTRYMLIGEK